MSTKQTLFSGCLVALLGAAAAAQSPPEDDQQQADCPDFVRGSTLSVKKVDRGVQLTIATPRPHNVRLLRAMTYQAAGYIESHQRGPSTEDDTEQEGLPPLDLAVADIAGGARVSILAVNKSDVGMVRDQANKLQQIWRFNVCVNGSQMRA